MKRHTEDSVLPTAGIGNCILPEEVLDLEGLPDTNEQVIPP